MTITKVDGIERFPTLRGGSMDTSTDLRRCPFCDSPAGYRWDPQHRDYLRAECSNTSCGIATPFHYKTREDAAYAWNRKPGDPPKRDSPHETIMSVTARLPQTLLQSQMMGYGTGFAFKDKVCEGCRRAYPKNASGQHVWPSGIGGGDFRECTATGDER